MTKVFDDVRLWIVIIMAIMLLTLMSSYFTTTVKTTVTDTHCVLFQEKRTITIGDHPKRGVLFCPPPSGDTVKVTP